jgi:broad specificity phosphatase PhoE
VHSSDLSRARETAEIAARHLPAQFVGIEAGLRERNFGILEGMTRSQMAESFPDLWDAYQNNRRIMPPGSEPHAQVSARMNASIATTLARTAADGTALMVSHGGAIRVWLSHATGRAIAPLANGALFRVAFADGQVVDAESL